MILVFGGTTEGRKAVETLEEGSMAYYYSTKTGEQAVALHHGIRLDGALDTEAMQAFCREHAIRLVIDAAHPFASLLHHTVGTVCKRLGLPAIRYERIYPPRDEDITWIDDYGQIPRDISSLLATTGVQSIARLKPLEAGGMKVYYRILQRESSIALARRQGATDEQLCFYADSADIGVDAEAILLKESGLTGGFCEKVEAARARGMRVIALKRPQWPTDGGQWTTVNGPYGLRRAVERLLPEFYPLKSGLTTGTCATAAAIAAVLQLLKRPVPSEVPVLLPDGETIQVAVDYADGYGCCTKVAGDDPDVTDGLEIRVRAELTDGEAGVAITGGEGVGRFTLPGFDYPPGEAAINRAPRQMIRQNLSLIAPRRAVRVTVSVPRGEEAARHTFNPRLGIEGGISIIGVSGIVKPFSEEAFIDSIRKCLAVAKASGAERVVINSGGKSERFVKALYKELPQQAFVEYGNYIGETLKMAGEMGMAKVTLGVMLGKAVKLAAGHLDTHSRKATMDKTFVRKMLVEAGCDMDIGGITLARELWERLPQDRLRPFAKTIISHCARHCRQLLPGGELTILLIDDNGNVYSE